jgi:cyanate permease
MIMFGSALLPVLALACVSYGTPWVPRDLLEMLSLMTPVLLAVFVGNHLRRWGVTGPERPRARHRRGGSTRS